MTINIKRYSSHEGLFYNFGNSEIGKIDKNEFLGYPQYTETTDNPIFFFKIRPYR